MATERPSPEIPQLPEKVVFDMIMLTFRSGEEDRNYRGVNRLNLGYQGVKHAQSLGLIPPGAEYPPEFLYLLPDYLEAKQAEDFMTYKLGIGFNLRPRVDIFWDANTKRITSFKKRSDTVNSQNWHVTNSEESVALLREDPWISRVDRELLSDVDDFGRSPDERMRGNFYLVSFKPTIDKSLHTLYHFDIYGKTRSFKLLAYRVIDHPGREIIRGYNKKDSPMAKFYEVVIPFVGRYSVPTTLTAEELLRNVIYNLEPYRFLDPKNPQKEDWASLYRQNYWGIKRLE